MCTSSASMVTALLFSAVCEAWQKLSSSSFLVDLFGLVTHAPLCLHGRFDRDFDMYVWYNVGFADSQTWHLHFPHWDQHTHSAMKSTCFWHCVESVKQIWWQNEDNFFRIAVLVAAEKVAVLLQMCHQKHTWSTFACTDQRPGFPKRECCDATTASSVAKWKLYIDNSPRTNIFCGKDKLFTPIKGGGNILVTRAPSNLDSLQKNVSENQSRALRNKCTLLLFQMICMLSKIAWLGLQAFLDHSQNI